MRTVLRAGRRPKYGATPVRVDGYRFASIKEGARYRELRVLERAGAITDLVLQPKFPLHVAGRFVCYWVGDFQYRDTRTSAVVIEDTKGFRTPVYRLKKKMVEAEYGIQVIEV